jgi:phage gp36-like protein
MGNYIEVADIEARLGQPLTAQLVRETAGGGVYLAALAAVIKAVEETVDNYLGSRYTVPMAATGYVRRLTMALVLHDLYSMSYGGAVPDKAQKAYDDAMVDLLAVADGKRAIGGATLPTAAAVTAGLVVESEDALFDRDSLRGF